MTYYINPIWFYLMNVSTGLQALFLVVGGAATLLTIIITPIWINDNDVDIADMDDNEKKTIGIFKKIIVAGIISLFIGILIPSKETCIEMMIASQVTHENVSATKEEIYKIIDYITDKVNGEESEDKE